jgi:hypothetical protein
MAGLAAAAAFGACWWGLAAAAGLDSGAAAGVATVPSTVVLTVLGVWAGRARREKKGGPSAARALRIDDDALVLRRASAQEQEELIRRWLLRHPEADEQAQRDTRDASAMQQSAASVQPPAQPGVYDDLVRRTFAELVQPGRLMFNPPDRMQLGHTERIEVRLARTLELDTELLEHLRGYGEPQLEEIPTAPLMAVTLRGDGFRITAYSDEEQSVTQDGVTTWEFDIRALERGQQRLVMCVSLRIPVAGQPLEHKSIPVREATIDVQVSAPTLVGHFVSNNWQWFIGTAIAITAVVAAVLYH